jgi:hypothetical protein
MMGNGKVAMNTIRQKQRNLVATASLVALAVGTIVRAGEPQQPLLAEYVSAFVFAEPCAPTNSVNSEMAIRCLQQPPYDRTAGDRWEQFESDFGIQKKDPSLVKGSLESAKYRLDRTVFVANEFLLAVEDKLSFDYKVPSRGRAANSNESARTASSSAIPLWDPMANAHFKSDINLDMTGQRAFVGVQLVLPIGN